MGMGKIRMDPGVSHPLLSAQGHPSFYQSFTIQFDGPGVVRQFSDTPSRAAASRSLAASAGRVRKAARPSASALRARAGSFW